MSKWAGLSAILLAMLMVLTVFHQPVSVLRAETSDGQVILCTPVNPRTPITLTFTHSMYGGFVAETYLLSDEGALARQRVVTERAAAAEYYATDGRVRRTHDGFEVVAGPFVTSQLAVHVDQRGAYRLSIGSSAWNLSEIVGASASLRLIGESLAAGRVPTTCSISP